MDYRVAHACMPAVTRRCASRCTRWQALDPADAKTPDAAKLAHAARVAMAAASDLPLHAMSAKDLRAELKRAHTAEEAKKAK